jgi:hypothetical protein
VTRPATPKQSLLAHLAEQHNEIVRRGTHNHWALKHRHMHDTILLHTHAPDGWRDGGHQRVVRLVLVPPKNPASTKAEDRNWTLQVSGHQKSIVQFVRLYGTYGADAQGAMKSAEQWLSYIPANWVQCGPSYELKVQEDG